MGTTAVAMAIGEEQLAIAHAGDSRAYRFRGGSVTRLTRDHSVAEEMRAARPEMTDEELATFAHRNVVTRSLGSKEELEPAVYVGRVQPGDIFLLCSDGLWGVVPDGKMTTILRQALDLESACQQLVDAANDGGRPGQRLGAAGPRRLSARPLPATANPPMIRALRRAEKDRRVRRAGRRRQDDHGGRAGRARRARLGRKTLVCTIDPAPRLADALGVGGLGPEPRPVPAEACRALGIPEEGAGRLFAVRLDTARAFARLVDEQVADPEMRRRIFDNAIYRQITTSLTGSQEYAATLALYELAREGAYDLIVLDTPPTANALDFLDAPKRIAAAVSSPALSWFARPPEGRGGAGRLSFRRLRAGGALVLRRLAKLVGSRFLDDVGGVPDRLSAGAGRVPGARQGGRRACCAARTRRSCWCWCRRWPPSTRRSTSTAGCATPACRSAAFIANRVQPAPGLTDAGALATALRASPAFADLSDAALAEAAARLAPLAAHVRGAARGGAARDRAAGGAGAGDGDHPGPAARSRRGQPG